MNRPDSRERILSSAIEVFAEKGKHRATMKEIASRASIGTSLLYRTYPTKSNLYREVLEKVMEGAFRQFEGAARLPDGDRDTVQTLLRIADASLDVLFRNPHSAKIVLHAMVNDALEFLSAAKNAKSRAGGAKTAAFERLLGNVGVAAQEKGLAGIEPEHVLALIAGVNLTYLLGKPIAEVFLGMSAADQRELSDGIRKNVLDVWTHGISNAMAK